MKTVIKLSVLVSMFCAFLPGVAAAQQSERIYFADHVIVKPGQAVQLPYNFPSAAHVINCYAGTDAGSHIGKMEWTYKGEIYKMQIGNHIQEFSLALTRDDVPDTQEWHRFGQRQIADAAGMLVITNMSKSSMDVNCSYSIGPNPYNK